MSLKIDDDILSSNDCLRCQKCCKFDPDELIDAPLFTEEQMKKASGEFEIKNLCFEQRGKLWQVVLKEIEGSDKKVCPFYNLETTFCDVHTYEIFDCYTWPFYIMKKEGKVVITLSPDCQAVLNRDIKEVKQYARTVIGPKMIQTAKKYPDLITDYHNGAIVLYEFDDFPGGY